MEATQSGFHKITLAGVREKDWQGTRLESNNSEKWKEMEKRKITVVILSHT